METTDRGALLAPLLTALASHASLVDELVAAARGASPDVARLPAQESRRHVALLFAAGLAAFGRAGSSSADLPGSSSLGLAGPSSAGLAGSSSADLAGSSSVGLAGSSSGGLAGSGSGGFAGVASGAEDGADFVEAARLGADRAAQGVSIAGLLAGVRAARTRVLEIAVVRGRDAGIPDEVLLGAALDFDRYVGALERHVVDGYNAAERSLARRRRDRRDTVLRALLCGTGERPDPNELAGFGLRPFIRYHCLVFDITEPSRAEPLEQRLTAGGGLFGTVEGRLAGLAPRVPDAERLDPATLVVVSPPLPLERAVTGYRLCVAALPAASALDCHGPQSLLDLAGETALAAQPDLAGLLCDALLAALDPSDDFHRELAATALSYLDHGQRLDRTAAALHVHPNTVRYRLRGLQDRTGLPLDDLTVLQTLRSWWALHNWLHRTDRSG